MISSLQLSDQRTYRCVVEDPLNFSFEINAILKVYSKCSLYTITFILQCVYTVCIVYLFILTSQYYNIMDIFFFVTLLEKEHVQLLYTYIIA